MKTPSEPTQQPDLTCWIRGVSDVSLSSITLMASSISMIALWISSRDQHGAQAKWLADVGIFPERQPLIASYYMLVTDLPAGLDHSGENRM